MYFDASRQEEHDGVLIISPAFSVQKLFAKNYFCKNVYFDVSWPPNPSKKGQFWRTLSKEQLKNYRLPFFRSLLPIIGSEIMSHFRRNMESRKLWHLVTFGDLNIDLNEKMTDLVSEWFLTSFRTLFPFCATTPRSWVRSPPADHESFGVPAQRGLREIFWWVALLSSLFQIAQLNLKNNLVTYHFQCWLHRFLPVLFLTFSLKKDRMPPMISPSIWKLRANGRA